MGNRSWAASLWAGLGKSSGRGVTSTPPGRASIATQLVVRVKPADPARKGLAWRLRRNPRIQAETGAGSRGGTAEGRYPRSGTPLGRLTWILGLSQANPDCNSFPASGMAWRGPDLSLD